MSYNRASGVWCVWQADAATTYNESVCMEMCSIHVHDELARLLRLAGVHHQ